mmetsp:Transcript_326/g.387  ORF Transcript_326/g.387 Transcript_326/m.387 type:complete len:1387 (+) Transcript_326:122-4282(+)
MDDSPASRRESTLPSDTKVLESEENMRRNSNSQHDREGNPLTKVFSQVMDLQRAMGGQRKILTSKEHGVSFERIERSLLGKGIKRFRRAVMQVIDRQRMAKLRGNRMVSQASTTQTSDFSERLIDYFLIFETNLIQGRQKDQPMTLKGELKDHAPSFEHKDCPISDKGWAMMAFPKAPTLSFHYRPPSSFYSVFTQTDGSRNFAVFLQYDEEIDGRMRDQLKRIPMENRRQSTVVHSPSVVDRLFKPFDNIDATTTTTGDDTKEEEESWKMNPDCRYGSIRVRSKADVKSELTGNIVGRKGTIFSTRGERHEDDNGQIYLKLADGSGWVFMNDPRNLQNPIIIKAENKTEKESVDEGDGDDVAKDSKTIDQVARAPPPSRNSTAAENFHRGDIRLISDRLRRPGPSSNLLESDYRIVQYEFHSNPLDLFSILVDSYDDIIIINVDKKLSRLKPHSQVILVNGEAMPLQGGPSEMKYVQETIHHYHYQQQQDGEPIRIQFHVPYHVNEDCVFPIIQHGFEAADAATNIHVRATQPIYRPRVLGIISHYPLFEQFEKTLVQVLEACRDNYDQGGGGRGEDALIIERIIAMLVHKLAVPIPGRFGVAFSIRNEYIGCSLSTVRNPFLSAFPLKALFDVLSVENILIVFSALVHESRVVFHSHSLKALTVTAQCFLQLLYPMSWTFTYIPVLPVEGIMALQSLAPFIIGVPSDVFMTLEEPPENVFVVDLNQNRVLTPSLHDDDHIENHGLSFLGQQQRQQHAGGGDKLYHHKYYTRHRASSSFQLNTTTTTKPSHVTRARSTTGFQLPRQGASYSSSTTTSPPSRSSPHIPTYSSSTKPHFGHGTSHHHPPRRHHHRQVAAAARHARFPTKYYSYLKKVFKIALHMRSIDNDFVVSSQGKNKHLLRFDRQVYAAIYHFYASLLQGYRKYLVVVDSEPCFNIQGFLSSVKDDDAKALLKHVVGSKDCGMSQSFYIFLTEDILQGPVHEYINAPTKDLQKRINDLNDTADDVFMYKVTPDGMAPPNETMALRRQQTDLCKPPSNRFAYPWSSSSSSSSSPSTTTITTRSRRGGLNHEAIKLLAAPRIQFERSKTFLAHCRIRKAKPLCEFWSENLPSEQKVEFFFIKVFKGEVITKERMESLERLLQDQTARRRLRTILKQPRIGNDETATNSSSSCSTTYLSLESFGVLSQVLAVATKQASKAKDYETVLVIWNTSTRFITEEDNGRKIHLEEKLKDDPVWADLDFWVAAAKVKAESAIQKYKEKKALMQAKSEKHKRSLEMLHFSEKKKMTKKTKKNIESSSSVILQEKNRPSKDNSYAMQVKQEMVEWLPRAIFKMVESGANKSKICDFLQWIVTEHELPEKESEELKVLLDKSITAIQAINADPLQD